jgi:transcriptional regulator with XRE-family HTH domain
MIATSAAAAATPAQMVAANLAALRKLRGYTTRSLSARLNQLGHRIDPSGITKIEHGRRAVDVGDLVALAVALCVSPDRVLFGPRADDVTVHLTPTVAVTRDQAWAWAAGEVPLPADPYGPVAVDEVEEDFRHHARPFGRRSPEAVG